MSNVLIFSFGRQGWQEACQLEAAIEHRRIGDNVLFVTCGSSIGICNNNLTGDPIRCFFCKKRQKNRVRRYVGEDVNVVCIDDFCSKEILDTVEETKFSYKNLDDLRELIINDIEVGYGALSSYVTYTRNIDLSFNSLLKSYIDCLIKLEIKESLAAKAIVDEFKPELIILHNGRFAHYKAILGLAISLKIKYIVTETITAADGTVMKDFYEDSIPHDVHARCRKINSFWNLYTDSKSKINTAISFYNNRKNAKFAGDIVYVQNQQEGKMPESWDSHKYNIAIFNSSEDEFFAICGSLHNGFLFNSQIEGITRIVNHFIDNPNIHFTLRVHPHLKGLPFPYHQNLYKLNMPNLTVIPADSDISTYSIMEASDKVIVFGSTMGIESTFWGKPTINVGYSLYGDLGVTYNPTTEKELWELILNFKLPPMESIGTLKYGLYLMSNQHESFKYISTGKISHFYIFGRSGSNYNIYKLFGSSYLYSRIEKIYSLLNKCFPLLNKFKSVPL